MGKRDLKNTSFRLSAEARRLLAALAERQAINRTAVLVLEIRKAAKDQGVDLLSWLSRSARSGGISRRASAPAASGQCGGTW